MAELGNVKNEKKKTFLNGNHDFVTAVDWMILIWFDIPIIESNHRYEHPTGCSVHQTNVFTVNWTILRFLVNAYKSILITNSAFEFETHPFVAE